MSASSCVACRSVRATSASAIFRRAHTFDSPAPSRGVRQRQRHAPRPLADPPLDLDRAGKLLEPRRQHQRLAAIEVRQRLRRHVGLRAGERRRQPRHHRALQLGEQLAHPLLHLLGRADMREGAAPELRAARHQKAVRRRSDADHEHPRASAHRRDGVEQLLLVADRAVGEEHHLPQMARRCSPASVSAARIAGTISVPPRASSASTNSFAARCARDPPAPHSETASPSCRRSGSR